MKLHFPDDYEAHRIRTPEFLAALAKQFDTTIEAMTERNTQMARGRPRKTGTAQAEQLSLALSFIKVGTSDDHAHVSLADNMAVSFNSQIAAGYPIAEELKACPHAAKLLAALTRCGKSLVIAETPNGALSIKGDKLRALVPCVAADTLPTVTPDAPVAVVDDKLKDAFRVCGTLASEAGTRVIEASLLLEANQCTGTNGAAILQYWHGIDLPPHMVLPKVFTDAVAAVKQPLTGFGYSWPLDKVASVTFWFEGGAWLKTQCYEDRWPDINNVLNHQTFPTDTLTGLFEAIEAVHHFSDDQRFICFADGKVQSHESDAIGAQYEVKGLMGGKKFDAKLVKQVAPYCNTIDLTTYDDRAFFFGENVRGAIMGLKVLTTEVLPEDVDQTPIDRVDPAEGWSA